MTDTTFTGSAATAQVAVVDADRLRVLLEQHDGVWRLPRVVVSTPWFETGYVAEALRQVIGVDVFVQRCLWGDDNEVPATDRLYVGQALQAPKPDDRRNWFTLDRLPRLDKRSTSALVAVTAWLDGRLGGQDWERQNWMGEVRGFVSRVVGRDPVALQQIRTGRRRAG